MTGLADPYLKLNWAKRHLEVLDEDLEAFHKSDPCRFSRYDDREHGRHVVRVELTDVPDNIPLRCGDAFYCMRASLDQLVWRLAKLNSVIPDRRVQFPIIETWDEDSRGRFKVQLTDVPADAIAIIRNLQPAEGMRHFEGNLLWKLNAMCNLDKHRRICANGSHVQFNLPAGVDPNSIVFESFDTYGTLSVPLSEKRKLDFDPNVTFQVSFGDVTTRVVLGPTDIRDVYQFIYDAVLPRFLRFFAQKSG
jgi:hypothetical protein